MKNNTLIKAILLIIGTFFLIFGIMSISDNIFIGIALIIVSIVIDAIAINIKEIKEALKILKNPNENYMAVGLAIGSGIGTTFGIVFGIIFDNLALGLSIGMIFGTSIGTAIGISIEKKK